MKKANETDEAKVLDAVHAGDSIPAGFSYAPYEKDGPVFELELDDHANLLGGGEVRAATPQEIAEGDGSPRTVAGAETSGLYVDSGITPPANPAPKTSTVTPNAGPSGPTGASGPAS